MQTCASGYLHTCTSGHDSTSTIILKNINSTSSSHRLSSLSRCRDPANSMTVAAKYIHIANQAFQLTPLCQITRNGCFMKYGSSFLPPITQESFNPFPPHTLRRCSKRLRTLSGPCATSKHLDKPAISQVNQVPMPECPSTQ